MKHISNSDDVIDSRDVIARIDELEELETAVTDAREAMREADADALEDAQTQLDNDMMNFDKDDQAELAALRALAEKASWSPDWPHGEILINDDYFVDYTQKLAEDIGDIPRDAPWPIRHIDWEAAAGELKNDYMRVDFDGVDYWIQA